MTPDRTEKPALRYKGRRFFLWVYRAAGESHVLSEPEEPHRTADPDASVPDGE